MNDNKAIQVLAARLVSFLQWQDLLKKLSKSKHREYLKAVILFG